MACANLIFIPNFFASLTIPESELFLVSIIRTSIPLFLYSIAVSYAESLLVNIIGFFPAKTP